MRRRVALVGVCGFLGLITSVLVAWLCAVYARPSVMHMYRIDAPDAAWVAWESNAIGFREIYAYKGAGWWRKSETPMYFQTRAMPWKKRKIGGPPQPDLVRMDFDLVQEVTTASSLPSWLQFESRNDQEGTVAADASGWPLPCLVSRWRSPKPMPNPLLLATGVLRLATPTKLDNPFDNTLPISPRPSALILDSAVFGVLWAGLAYGARGTKRTLFGRFRRRRGLCPACAYDLRSDFAAGCSECGWGRPSQPPAEP